MFTDSYFAYIFKSPLPIIIITIAMQSSQDGLFHQTFNLIEERVKFFQSHQMSAQNHLSQFNKSFSVRSVSEIIPILGAYHLAQTPLNINLCQIYAGGKDIKNGASEEQIDYKFVLPPISEGEDSINQEQGFEPTFKWFSTVLIDSTYLSVDHVEPKKVQKGKVLPEWKGITQLLIFNVDKKIYLKSQMGKIQTYLKSRLDRFPWVKMKRCKEIYYKGKASIILKFEDQASACFAYYNLNNQSMKDNLGNHNNVSPKDFFGNAHQIIRITQNKIKERIGNDVTLIFRRLPSTMTKEIFLNLFKKGQGPTWVQQFIEINDYKYTICKVSYLDDAFKLVTTFQSKMIKDAKVNYHPKSSKQWRHSQTLLQ